MARIMIPIYLLIIFGVPCITIYVPFIVFQSSWIKGLFTFFAPIIFSLMYVLTAGILSMPYHKSIVPGRFPRKLDHPIYGPRRLYGLCWTAVYYSGPIYFLFLSIPMLKWLLFRLFGYKGSTDFTVYPDTWIRDLPLLTIGKGAYISNKATLGTNLVLKSGSILVNKIDIGEGALIGHAAKLAPGVTIGNRADVGVGAEISLGVEIRDGASVGALSSCK